MPSSRAHPDAWATLRPSHRDAMERFILFWGEMASNWGINRTMAQLHALLYCSEEPLDTDTIMQRLQISRGNANMNLRSLMAWNLVRKVHLAGSRKDFYSAEKNVWEITAQIIRERERRELQPVVAQIEACRAILHHENALSPAEKQFDSRLEQFAELARVFETVVRTLLPLVHSGNASAIQGMLGAVRESLGPVSTNDTVSQP